MKRTHMLLCQRLLLLLILFLVTCGVLQPVEAETGNQEENNSLRIVWASISPPEPFCVGQKIDLSYRFLYVGPPPLVPARKSPRVAVVNISAQGNRGTVFPPQFKHANVISGKSSETSKFTYTAKQAGDENIQVEVSMGGYRNQINLQFKVTEKDDEKCKEKVSMQFYQNTTMSYQIVSIMTTYGGSGQLSINEDGQISGSGIQTLWSDIPPYSSGGGSCKHNPPWEGSSGITFSGQVGENGDTSVTMEMEALSVYTTSLTCTDGEYTASIPFPGYTYSPCQVQLAGFNFEAATLDVPFNCPGQAPFTVPITIIPRRES
jgi:hypothetical protein